jgi:hypothetical protein
MVDIGSVVILTVLLFLLLIDGSIDGYKQLKSDKAYEEEFKKKRDVKSNNDKPAGKND